MRVSEVHREQELWEHGALIPWLHRGKEVAVLLSVWTTGHGVSGFNPRTGFAKSCEVIVEKELISSKSRLRFPWERRVTPKECSVATHSFQGI